MIWGIRPGALCMGAACAAAFAAMTLGEHLAARRLAASAHVTAGPAASTEDDWEGFLKLPEECRREWGSLTGTFTPASTPAEQARARAIERSIQGLQQMCGRHGGDWDGWEEEVKPYQDDLEVRVMSLSPAEPGAGTAMGGTHGFPLVECEPRIFIRYMYDLQLLDQWHAERSVAAASRWLKQRGIDLIVVPVPKMTEVYPEFFAAHCPADRVVVPRFRRIVQDLLQADVEVIDPLPLLLAERDPSPEFLYQPVEPHWSARGQRVAARAIAERLQRYGFGQQALADRPVCKVVEAPYDRGFEPVEKCPYFAVLGPEQRRRAEKVQPASYPAITKDDGAALGHCPYSPVMLIGDSYNKGMADWVTREANLPLRLHYWGSGTTQMFAAFLRDPALLNDCKVVVWTVCMTTLVNGDWPIPPAVRAALKQPGPR
jgi:hypothetical protein